MSAAQLTGRQIDAKVTADTEGKYAVGSQMHDALCLILGEVKTTERQLREAVAQAQENLTKLSAILDTDDQVHALDVVQSNGAKVDSLTGDLRARIRSYQNMVWAAKQIAAS